MSPLLRATLLLTLAGCAALRAPITAPEVTLPAAFSDSPAPRGPLASWQTFFPGPQLHDLLHTALTHDFDVLRAAQRIEGARAALHGAKGARLPQVTLNAAGGVRRFGLYTMDGAGNATTDITPGRLVPVDYPQLDLRLDASWEVSLWGRLRHLQQAAKARYLASLHGRDVVVMNLVADVAAGWYELAALDETVAALTESRDAQRRGTALMRAQKEAGRTNELAVQQFEAGAAAVEGELAATLQRIAEVEAHLNLLLGRPAGPIPRSTDALRARAEPPATGVPADLLRFRPDVQEAEQLVAAAKFDVKAAKAAFFPSLSITAGGGLSAFNPKFLVTDPASLAYNVLGGLIAPLINRSAIMAEFKTARASQVDAMLAYQQTLLQSFLEVETHLSGLKRGSEAVDARERQERAVAQTVDMADALFRAGKVTYLDVLLAQQGTLDARLEVVEARLNWHWQNIALYRALGGGWSEPVATAAP